MLRMELVLGFKIGVNERIKGLLFITMAVISNYVIAIKKSFKKINVFGVVGKVLLIT